MWAIAKMTARVETAQRRVFPPRRARLCSPKACLLCTSEPFLAKSRTASCLRAHWWTLTSHGFVQIAASYRAHAVRSIAIAPVARGHLNDIVPENKQSSNIPESMQLFRRPSPLHLRWRHSLVLTRCRADNRVIHRCARRVPSAMA